MYYSLGFSLCTTETDGEDEGSNTTETDGEDEGSNTTESDGEDEGSNTTVIIVVVIVVISLLVALAVFLAMKYKAKSPEITPSNGNQKSGREVKPGVKQKKNKHSSSTTGMGEASGAVRMNDGQDGEKKKRRRKRSSSSPKVLGRSQV